VTGSRDSRDDATLIVHGAERPPAPHVKSLGPRAAQDHVAVEDLDFRERASRQRQVALRPLSPPPNPGGESRVILLV